jgi:hypothetical protein
VRQAVAQCPPACFFGVVSQQVKIDWHFFASADIYV